MTTSANTLLSKQVSCQGCISLPDHLTLLLVCASPSSYTQLWVQSHSSFPRNARFKRDVPIVGRLSYGKGGLDSMGSHGMFDYIQSVLEAYLNISKVSCITKWVVLHQP